VLEEVARRKRSLLAEEFECDVACGCLEDYLRRWLRLEVIEGSHVGVVNIKRKSCLVVATEKLSSLVDHVKEGWRFFG
jgi:hypothetical protein